MSCGEDPAPPEIAPVASQPPAPAPGGHVPSAARGRTLVARYECRRCHEERDEPLPSSKRCVGCHADILAGRFEAPAHLLHEWQSRVHSLPAAPSLEVAGHLFEARWIASYLVEPYDVRPHLAASMPRLRLDKEQAADIAAYLTANQAAPPGAPQEPPADAALVGRGRELFAAKGCGSCHRFAGADLSSAPDPAARSDAVALAPDLRVSRERVRRDRLASWIAHPARAVAAARMPHTPVTDDEARALAAFVLHTPLRALPPHPTPSRLPLLQRAVGFDEVRDRVFRKICWHCHAQPDYALGDGGPGMTGGFGFAARQLDLSTYESIMGGYLDADGEPTSLFAASPDGTPMLLAVLLARQHEEQGAAADLRGMPLGFPALSAEDVQLVESWIAQGRRR
jgi:mono/diheme cytochrome c family protein